MGSQPRGREGTGCGANGEEGRADLARDRTSRHRGSRDRDRRAARRHDLLPVELECRFTLEYQVELLLTARPLVVLFDQRLIRLTRDEDVGAE